MHEDTIPAKQAALHAAIQDALYGPDPNQVDARKAALKLEIDRIKRLVDAGLLGCIIVTELLDRDGTRVEMKPYGDPRLILQTASQLVRQSLGRAAPEPARESSPIEH
jgi:hypothetical protein